MRIAFGFCFLDVTVEGSGFCFWDGRICWNVDCLLSADELMALKGVGFAFVSWM